MKNDNIKANKRRHWVFVSMLSTISDLNTLASDERYFFSLFFSLLSLSFCHFSSPVSYCHVFKRRDEQWTQKFIYKYKSEWFLCLSFSSIIQCRLLLNNFVFFMCVEFNASHNGSLSPKERNALFLCVLTHIGPVLGDKSTLQSVAKPKKNRTKSFFFLSFFFYVNSFWIIAWSIIFFLSFYTFSLRTFPSKFGHWSAFGNMKTENLNHLVHLMG